MVQHPFNRYTEISPRSDREFSLNKDLIKGRMNETWSKLMLYKGYGDIIKIRNHLRMKISIKQIIPLQQTYYQFSIHVPSFNKDRKAMWIWRVKVWWWQNQSFYRTYMIFHNFALRSLHENIFSMLFLSEMIWLRL